jgi:CheY-like chemotaxis protein
VSNQKKRTVLVVDDEEDVRLYLQSALEDAGFDVVTAGDGFEALEQVKKRKPDLISLDLVMPRKSGVKFYREIQKEKRWSDIPVLVVTGHARDELGRSDLRELTMSGPGIYLEKPVKPANFIAAVKDLLGMEASDDERASADKIGLQSQIKNMVDDADAETLRELQEFIKRKREK